jgi:hypothetical protein
MAYDNICGWCRAEINLNTDDYTEADGCNLCKPCADALFSDDKAAFTARYSGAAARKEG